MTKVTDGTARLDVRRAVRCAIFHDYNRTLVPGDAMTLVPSKAPNDGVSATGAKWHNTIKRAAATLTGWGYTLSDDADSAITARDLVDKSVTATNGYLFGRLTAYRDAGQSVSCNEGS